MRTWQLLATWVALFLDICQSKTIVQELNISRTASASGKQLISLNGEVSSLGPTIRVQAGDTLNLLVNNDICEKKDLQLYGDDYCNTSIHFHGLVLENVAGGILGALSDGVPGVTQRSIPPQMSYWYNFTVPASLEGGTYWFHSHSSVQYGDGLRGIFLVDSPTRDEYLGRVVAKLDADGTSGGLLHDLPAEPSSKLIHEEIMAVSDWYSRSSVDILKDVMSPTGGPDPRVEGSTVNGDQGSVNFGIGEDTEYVALRVINVGMSGTNVLHVEGHRLCVVETDGVLTKPYMIDTLSIAVGQRFTLLIKVDRDTARARMVHGCGKMMGYVSKTHWLTRPGTDAGEPFDGSFGDLPGLDKSEKYRDFVPRDGELLPAPSQQISLDYAYQSELMKEYNTGMYAVNGDTMPEFLPDGLGVLLEGARGVRDPIQLHSGQVVEIAINSIDHMTHPWHMHGHTFQVISVGHRNDGPLYFDDPGSAAMRRYLEDVSAWEGNVPMARDTINIPGSSYAVIRFNASNPGFWLLHCHVEWHMAKGLGVILAEGDAHVNAVANAFTRTQGIDKVEDAKASTEVSSTEVAGQPPAKDSKLKVLLVYLFIMCVFNAGVWYCFFARNAKTKPIYR
ncbi:LAME_0G01508g1_1 [Lachancea meyersii CBS 8951]|uniref:LAME_0G01508g1_1 n=1 Tax=Lachancea meyersii CBS 8951 TaxID=1266667 RepID=A0A1G4K5D6_9SACH|nr:LAME_0G01508g1_1 [Lachancea meyersii CBS 8951]